MVKKVIFKILIFLVLIIFSGNAFSQPCREVVGYFASWKWYKRNKLVNPETIRYSNYTIINYAFFKPLPDGNIISGDFFADATLLLGKENYNGCMSRRDETTSLVYNAHLHGVKVIASIGGYTWSANFPGIAADATKRRRFAKSCSELIIKYNLDGIDIDWEFPGNRKQNGSYADLHNFTLLLQEIRSELDACGSTQKKNFLLTAAIGPAQDHMNMIEWEQVAPLLDRIHIMTYNYHGAWEKVTNHNAPLFATYGSSKYNIDFTISTLLQTHRVPASKITLGLAFYGRSVETNGDPSLYAASSGIPDIRTFSEEKGTPSYYSIVSKLALYETHSDPGAMTPYLTGKNGLRSFVSYDDPSSIRLKAAYAAEKHLAGVVIWDISGDYIETSTGSGEIAETPLCDAIREVFCQATTMQFNPECNPNLVAFPNPFREELSITWNSECSSESLKIRNQQGQLIFTTTLNNSGSLNVETTGWTKGIYIVQISGDGVSSAIQILKL